MSCVINKIRVSSVLLLIIGGAFLLSCDDVINPTLQSASPVLAVDGWINNKLETQAILLTLTQPYFDSSQPTGVSGATVTVADVTDGTQYSFVENPSVKGSYEWSS